MISPGELLNLRMALGTSKLVAGIRSDSLGGPAKFRSLMHKTSKRRPGSVHF